MSILAGVKVGDKLASRIGTGGIVCIETVVQVTSLRAYTSVSGCYEIANGMGRGLATHRVATFATTEQIRAEELEMVRRAQRQAHNQQVMANPDRILAERIIGDGSPERFMRLGTAGLKRVESLFIAAGILPQ